MSIKSVQVGMGVRGEQWAKVVHEDPRVENVGYVRRRVEKAKQTLKDWGVPDAPCYADLETALKETKPDIVILVTPPEVHHEQVSLSFKYGAHVMAEKPLSEELEESIDMVKQADTHNLKLAVGHNFRYLAVSQKIRQMIMSKSLGELGFANFTYIRNRDGRRKDLNDYPLEMKYPMLLEQSIHHLDLMRYCYNDEVESVQSMNFHPSWSTYAHECSVSALLKFKSGFHVNYLGTWTSGWNRFCFEWRTDMSKGVLLQKQQFSDLWKADLVEGLALEGERFKTPEEGEPLQEVKLEPCEAFVDDTRLLLSEFLDSIEHGTPLVTSGKDHIKTLGLTTACARAHETECKVMVDDYLKELGVPGSWI